MSGTHQQDDFYAREPILPDWPKMRQVFGTRVVKAIALSMCAETGKRIPCTNCLTLAERDVTGAITYVLFALSREFAKSRTIEWREHRVRNGLGTGLQDVRGWLDRLMESHIEMIEHAAREDRARNLGG